jgi:hypothetical protein
MTGPGGVSAVTDDGVGALKVCALNLVSAAYPTAF